MARLTGEVWTGVSRPGPAETRLLGATHLRSRHVLARTAWGDGVMLRILEGGAGRPIVFVHGRGHAASAFAPVADTIAARWRVLAIDLPGFGHSATPPFRGRDAREAMAWFVAPVRAIVDELGPHVVVVGHSLGGLVALEIALTRRVGGLVLVDAMGLAPELGLAPRLYFHADPERLARLRSAFGLADRSTPVARLREELLSVRGGRPEASRAFEALVPLRGPIHHRRADLHRIDTPTLLVWGRRDTTFPLAVAESARQRIPGARLCVVDAGHSPHLDAPTEVAEAIAGFVEELDGGPISRLRP